MKKIRSLIRWSLRIIAFVLVLCAVIFSTAFAFVIHGRNGSAILPADCGIVFGAAVQAVRNTKGQVVAETAGPGIARRVETAANLWKNGDVKRLFLSGGKGEGMGRSEAEVMGEFAEKFGVPKKIITLEGESTSTVENLTNVRSLVKDCESVVAISDDYHLTRIKFLAWQQGWSLQTYPAQRKPDSAFQMWSVLRETLAMIYYAFGGK